MKESGWTIVDAHLSPVVDDRAKLPKMGHTFMKIHRSWKHGANLKEFQNRCALRSTCVRACMRGSEMRNACMREWMRRNDGSSHRCWSCNLLIEALFKKMQARFCIDTRNWFLRYNFKVAFLIFTLKISFFVNNIRYDNLFSFSHDIIINFWKSIYELHIQHRTRHEKTDPATQSFILFVCIQ